MEAAEAILPLADKRSGAGVEELDDDVVSPEPQQQQLEQTAQLRAALLQNQLDAWAGLRSLPPRLMLCDAEDRMPKHERWFRARAEASTQGPIARPTLSWGQKEDGGEQMQWKSCSSRPPKQRRVIRVSADDYPPFALGFLIETDQGAVRVNAPDAESKRRWLAQFEELEKATKLFGLSDAELIPLAITHGCFTAADVSAALLVGLGSAALDL